jgi:ABC-type proline/glycine betaine transport system permease subunit
MNKSLVIVAGIIAAVGLIVNFAVDRDNVYDLTIAGLWFVTLILIFAGAFVGGGRKRQTSSGTSLPSGIQR